MIMRPTSDSDERARAIAVAKVLLRAPNIAKGSDIALLARQLLKAVGEAVG